MKVSDEMRAVWANAAHSCMRCKAGNHGDCYGGKMVHKAGSYRTREKVRFRCACKTARHRLFDGVCTFNPHSGQSPCGRPATARFPMGARRGQDPGSGYEVERCNFHASVLRRMDRKRVEDEDRAAAQSRRLDELDRECRAAAEWSRRLREEFGVETVEGIESRHVRVRGEQLYGQIARADAILRDIVPDEENPFR